MTHAKLFHTHVNPKNGRNEPLFVEVNGPKETCKECAKEKEDAKRQGRKGGG